MEYIGQTYNLLQIRINQHRSDTHNNSSNIVEYLHFQLHDFYHISFKILSIHKKLNDRLLYESIFIKSGNTLYPYELNFIL